MKYSTVKEMSLSTQLNKFATSKYIIHNNNITLILPHPGNMIKPCKFIFMLLLNDQSPQNKAYPSRAMTYPTTYQPMISANAHNLLKNCLKSIRKDQRH